MNLPRIEFEQRYWPALLVSALVITLTLFQGASLGAWFAIIAILLAWSISSVQVEYGVTILREDIDAVVADDRSAIAEDDMVQGERKSAGGGDLNAVADSEIGADLDETSEHLTDLPIGSNAFLDLQTEPNRTTGAISDSSERLASADSGMAVVSNATVLTSRVLGEVQTDLGQIRQLLSDAVKTLDTSFEGLRNNARDQSELVRTLVKSMDRQDREADEEGNQEEGTIRQFITETDQILQEFVRLILSGAEDSMASVTRIEEIGDHMTMIEGLLNKAKQLADQSSLLAVNARIQAAHSGTAGVGFGVVADEIKELAHQSHAFTDEIGGIVRRAQDSVAATAEYIAEIASKDMDQTLQSKQKVDGMLSGIDAANEELGKTVDRVSVLSGQLASDVGDAIRSLQFEDIVRQVIERCEACLKRGEDLFEQVQLKIGEMDHNPNAMADLQTSIDRFSETEEAETRSVVDQESLSAGAVELF